MKCIIFDSNNLSHIAFHRAKSIVVKEYGVADLDRISGMMLHVFFLKLHKILKKFKNSIYIAAWDSKTSTKWRRTIYPEYKNDRVYSEDPTWRVLFSNINEIKSIFDSYPIYNLEVDGFEADDLIYELSSKLKEDYDVVIVSTDSDLKSIAQKFKVKIFNPITQKYVDIPKDYDVCVYKSLLGDKSDNISGVRGFGEKKAEELAKKIFIDKNNINVLKEEQKEILFRNLKIIDISNNPNLCNLKINVEDIITSNKSINLNKIRKFFFDKKLKSLLEQFENITNILSLTC